MLTSEKIIYFNYTFKSGMTLGLNSDLSLDVLLGSKLSTTIIESKKYLEKVKWQLFLDSKATNFVMINKIKIYLLTNLFSKILIPCNLHTNRLTQHVERNLILDN